MKVIQVKVEKLIPYANNARTHSDAQVTQIASSIREFGFNNPILVDENHGVIAGHGRLLAAKKLELDTVPCIVLEGLTESKKRAFIIADNKIALNSGWDEELLRLELEGLSDAEQFATGFSPEEFNLLFRAWDSDIEKMDGIEPKDSLAKEKIIISCNPDNKDMVWEKVTNLIDSLGLEDVIVS